MLKRFFVAAGLWLGLISAVAAQSTSIIGGGLFGDGKKPITFAFSFTDHEEEASQGTTISYNACTNGVTTCNFGAADPNRIVVVCAGARMATVNTITSMMIGGVSASVVTGTAVQESATTSNSACYQAAVPTGTTGTVSITWGAATARTGIAIYRIVTGTTTRNSASGSATGSPPNCSLTINAGGEGVAFEWQNSTNVAPTWSNATGDYSATSGGTSGVGSAHVTATSAAINAGTGAAAQVLSCAAWGP